MDTLIQCRTDVRTLRLAQAHHVLRQHNSHNFFAKYRHWRIIWSDDDSSFTRSVHQYTGNRRWV